ncbi:MAG: hypothetical protein ACRDYD_06790, partial [Acidimicrobiales bacterium]
GWIARGASQGGLSPNVALGARSASTAPAGGPALAQTYDPSRTFGAPGPANYSAPSGLFKVSESLTVSPAPAPYVPAPTSYA